MMNGRTDVIEYAEVHDIEDLAEAERLMTEEMAEKCDRAWKERRE